MLYRRFCRNDIGRAIAAILFLQGEKVYRKFFHIFRELFCCSRHLKTDGNAMIVAEWKRHLARMMDAPIHPKVTCAQIAENILTNFLFNTPFPAVINAKQIFSRLKLGNARAHMKVIIHQDHAGKNTIQCHPAFARIIAQPHDLTLFRFHQAFYIGTVINFSARDQS